MKKYIKMTAKSVGVIVGGLKNYMRGPCENILMSFREGMLQSQLKRIGDGVQIRGSVIIRNPSKVEIGSRVAINEFCHIWGGGGVVIEDDVMIASHCVITSQGHIAERGLHRNSKVERPVILEKNVWLGAGVIVLPGVRIGYNSIIGAGTTVSRDVPPNVIIIGAPSKVHKEI